MSTDPVVVAPTLRMALLWAQENPDRFTRRPRVITEAVHLRGHSGRELVLVQGARGGPYVDYAIDRQVWMLEAIHDCTVERVWLP